MTKPKFSYYTTSELVRAATAPKISTKSRIQMQEEIARREAEETAVRFVSIMLEEVEGK